MMRALVIALLALGASVAHAAPALTIDEALPPTLVIGRVGSTIRIDRVDVHSRAGITWVTLALSPGRFHRHRDTSVIDLDAPAGTRVIGMAVTDATSAATTWSVAQPVLAAERMFRTGPSPALVSMHGSTGGVDHFELALQDARAPASVAIAMQFVDLAEVHVEAPPHVPLFIDDVPGQVLGLERLEPTEADHVDRATSLVLTSGVGELVRFATRPEPTSLGQLDKSMIRRRIRDHRAQLTQCYLAVAQWMPSLHGSVMLHFTIDSLGEVHDAYVDGELQHPGVLGCLAREVSTWEFPSAPGEGKVDINYPIEFRLREPRTSPAEYPGDRPCRSSCVSRSRS